MTHSHEFQSPRFRFGGGSRLARDGRAGVRRDRVPDLRADPVGQEPQLDGESIVLTLRSGGQVTCDKTLIAKIEPDEVPYPEPGGHGHEPASSSRDDEEQDRSLLAGTPYGEIIASMSEAHGVDPMLVRALIQVESGYQPRARSRKGAMGLMQLMPSTAREYKVRNPFEPKANIEAGIKHLKSLIDKFERLISAWRRTTPGRGGQEVQRGPAVPRNAQLRHPHPGDRRPQVARGSPAVSGADPTAAPDLAFRLAHFPHEFSSRPPSFTV